MVKTVKRILQSRVRQWMSNVHPEVRLLCSTQQFSSSDSSVKIREKSGTDPAAPTNRVDQMSDVGSSQDSFVQPQLEKLYNIWNESSGTAEISVLKEKVAHASKQFDKSTRGVTESRRELDKNMLAYDEVHGRHGSMLRLRDKWDNNDAMEFAELVGKEVQVRKEVERTRENLRQAEENVGRWQVEHMDAMRKRYHEEQIWQDKWRVLGTYGTWVLIGLNSVVFLGSQFFHQKREVGRLKAIQDLINEKLPASVTNMESGVRNESGTKDGTQIIENHGENVPLIDEKPLELDRNVEKAVKNEPETKVEEHTNIDDRTTSGSIDDITSDQSPNLILQEEDRATNDYIPDESIKLNRWIERAKVLMKPLIRKMEKIDKRALVNI
eukprot:CAMPEP_0198289766 /NCGR_PEP_ID=MMETSP1449-20131203/7854_1 /TAXON_ID=420275 /ORGANISM="Attheya septentrionalis, Strain CCMP2084" /LENGTH=381 /DNA_ID=CAMNT_0043988153 /DNA_START=28 /DNA_END=1170 /DNA_ORIENTATION=+